MLKKYLFFLLLLGAAARSNAQVDTSKVYRVAVLLYPGVELLDFAGATDVFVKAAGVTGGKYQVYTLAMTTGMVSTERNTITIQPEYTGRGASPPPDILVIPGAPLETIDTLMSNTAFMGWLKQLTDRAGITMSVCTGAYFLAQAGLLKDKPATTHWYASTDFGTRYPGVRLVRDVRYVDAGRLVTASGVSSGIDGALYIVERYSGPAIAALVAKIIQYTPHHQEPWPLK
ncbi:GlxA family transcriptional regulator [Chitinophaga sp. Ak27]|uniref:GlxA family transcriptional regulator n=1 Tax=Chitinophaga sp. Ak27 TaxID=2726116 RepID=UPI00145DAFFA|nr:DJ-1/PfpI family protein [Chitinophaga sp. Ak27]NLU90839.1 DJ-1/PfpI family protein [Chitinophaga sp. Ak27]